MQLVRGSPHRPRLLVPLALLFTIVTPAHGQQVSSRAQTAAQAISQARRLDEQAGRLYRHGKLHEALILFKQALEVYEDALSPEHLDVARALNRVGRLHMELGEYVHAKPYLQRALFLRESLLPSRHVDLATSYSNLAAHYSATGNHDQAISYGQRSLEIIEWIWGPKHPDVAVVLNNLGTIHYQAGSYHRSEQLYKRSTAIIEESLGKEHPDLISPLRNLADLYGSRGDYFQAVPLAERAIMIAKKESGSDSLRFADSLITLGKLHLRADRNDEGFPFLSQAFKIRVEKLGPNNPNVAEATVYVGEVFEARQDYDGARQLYEHALKTYRKLGRKDNTAAIMARLANLHFAQGEYDQAVRLYQQSLDILEMMLDPEHPDLAPLLSELSSLYVAKGDLSRAFMFRERAEKINEHNLELLMSVGSERQKAAYMATLIATSYKTVSLHTLSAPNSPQALRLALTIILQRKGRILDAATRNFDVLRSHLDPDGARLFDRLTGVRSHLATLALRRPNAMEPELYKAELERLRVLAEELESAISERSAEFRVAAQPVTLEEVQDAIPKDTALVELVRYQPYNPKAKSGEKKWSDARYVAYVVPWRGKAAWADLGAASLIDGKIRRLHRAVSDPELPDVKDVKRLARELDEQTMHRIRGLLGGIRKVLLSPDGALNLVPFGALVDEENHYLIERFKFRYLTSGRDLLRLQVKNRSREGSLIIANPDFDHARIPSGVPSKKGDRSPVLQSSNNFFDLRFSLLPGTAKEAEALQDILTQATLLTGPSATEAALKKVHGPRILHIATHGFFLGDKESVPDQDNLRDPDSWPGFQGSHIENFLLRSGLALAGANRREGGDDDGILTALEAAGLDLQGTKLVVLSACETGVGKVLSGDGVYGLRRALVLAGTESLMMSLWKVPDDATRDLMVSYYQRLTSGEGRAEALRQVQLEMLANGNRSHPFYWASFILSGQWANLQGD